jgi:nucleotide-binding universal stress UspA family protein
MKLRKILFPTDLTRAGNQALELATALARDSGAHLIIAYIEEPLPADAELYYAPVLTDREQLLGTLQEVRPNDAQVPCEHRLLTGDPATQIIDLAQQEQVDLIVMPTHGRKGLSRLLMGSVAEAVVRRAPCPVLSVRQRLEAGSKAGAGE